MIDSRHMIGFSLKSFTTHYIPSTRPLYVAREMTTLCRIGFLPWIMSLSLPPIVKMNSRSSPPTIQGLKNTSSCRQAQALLGLKPKTITGRPMTAERTMQPASCTQGSSGRGLKTAGVKTQLGDPGWKAAEENETLGSKAWYENSGRRSTRANMAQHPP
jgi:hypothetical protein